MTDMIYQKRRMRIGMTASEQKWRGGPMVDSSRPSAYNDDPIPASSLPIDGSALDQYGNEPKKDTKTLLYVGGVIVVGLLAWAFSGKKGGKMRAKVSGHKAKKSKTRKR